MSKFPFMPLFLGDLLSDTLHLSSQEFGAYVLLFCHAWKHEAKVAVKDAQKIARVDNRHWGKVRAKLAPFFVPCEGLRGSASEVVHPRVAKELAKAAELSNKRKGAAVQMHVKKRASASVLHAVCITPSHTHQEQGNPLKGVSTALGNVEGAPARSLPLEACARSPASEQHDDHVAERNQHEKSEQARVAYEKRRQLEVESLKQRYNLTDEQWAAIPARQ